MTGERAVKLVFADLDDSFLARDKSIPAANLAALDLLAARGGCFVPCTGRKVEGVPAELMAHPATRFAVGSNGGIVMDARTGEVLHRSLMSVETVCRVYEQVRDLDVSFDAFVDGHVYAERARYDAMAGYGIDEVNLRVIRSLREPFDVTIPELIAGYDGVEKVTLYCADGPTREAAREILATFDEIGVTTSHPKNFEFMAKNTSKGSALTWLCAHLGIDQSATVAFGDSSNDVPMLMAAGDGVAVGNAAPEIKAAADHVCASCDDGGPGLYLRALLDA